MVVEIDKTIFEKCTSKELSFIIQVLTRDNRYNIFIEMR